MIAAQGRTADNLPEPARAYAARLRAMLPALRERYGVCALALFGSHVRGEQRPDSDLDVLVEFDGPATFDGFMGLKLELEDALRLPVDVVTTHALDPRLAPHIAPDLVDVA